ncbi:DUF3019 domain-containing protein [Corallincola luteus]|uniref:DUF3019 domain-containing protein n=1 Tax=Corallincola luteus TaxID=1775177 RepID=A0ABY2AI52_9GAMM|nr:DUF3019 domain-containing protein [Corallincola luteus]TCI02359.1 DUF3019 domain-containing protein [Corallincola luteus]
MKCNLFLSILLIMLPLNAVATDAPARPTDIPSPLFISKGQSRQVDLALLQPSEMVHYLRVRYAYQPIDITIDDDRMTMKWEPVAPTYVIVNRPKGRALHDRNFWKSVLKNYRDSSIGAPEFSIADYKEFSNSNFEVIAVNQFNNRPRFTVIGQVTIPTQAQVLADNGHFPSPIVIDPALQDTSMLTATPSKCVVQNKGEPCRTRIALNWQLDTPQDVCLHIGRRYRPLACWENQSSSVFHYEFDSTQTLNFWLSRMPDRRRLAEKRISVVWVYEHQKTPRRWRLF